LINSTI